jgi:hypothetical protein
VADTQADSYGLTLTPTQTALVSLLYDAEGILQYQYESILAIALEDGDIIGALTESGEGEWSVVVDSGFQGHGVATTMVKAVLAEGGSGFMVAGTDKGLEFLTGLYFQLSSEEREGLEVSSWADLEEMIGT